MDVAGKIDIWVSKDETFMVLCRLLNFGDLLHELVLNGSLSDKNLS